MTKAVIGLGSNLGNREEQLLDAGDRLRGLGEVEAASSIYLTQPIGPPQPDYLNMVVVLETELDPRDLLAELLRIENEMGRQRGRRFGPRTLDLDLLLYGDQEVHEPGLTVPHPRMTERRFTLIPLLEVWPDARLPSGEHLADFLPAVAEQEVEKVT